MPNQTMIQLSVKVTDGSYDSSISIPVAATKEQQDGAVNLWLSMMKQALELNDAKATNKDTQTNT